MIDKNKLQALKNKFANRSSKDYYNYPYTITDYNEALVLVSLKGGTILKLKYSLIDYNICRLAYPYTATSIDFDRIPKNSATKKYNALLKNKYLNLLINTV